MSIDGENPMTTIPEIQDKYVNLDRPLEFKDEETIDAECLLSFDYKYPEQPSEIKIDTDEFTALCPWTGLPDLGTLTITYTPSDQIIELKSVKFYLLSFRDVGIVQEHAANRILRDLVALIHPHSMKIHLDYKARGGLHTEVTTDFPCSDQTDLFK